MSTIAIKNHAWYKVTKKVQKQASLWDRFCSYCRENRVMIICGGLMANGNTCQALKLYMTLKNPENQNR